MTDASDAAQWAALSLDTLVFDDDLSGFDLSTLPAPGSALLPLVVEVDPELVADLKRAARLQGVSVDEIVRQRLRGAA